MVPNLARLEVDLELFLDPLPDRRDGLPSDLFDVGAAVLGLDGVDEAHLLKRAVRRREGDLPTGVLVVDEVLRADVAGAVVLEGLELELLSVERDLQLGVAGREVNAPPLHQAEVILVDTAVHAEPLEVRVERDLREPWLFGLGDLSLGPHCHVLAEVLREERLAVAGANLELERVDVCKSRADAVCARDEPLFGVVEVASGLQVAEDHFGDPLPVFLVLHDGDAAVVPNPDHVRRRIDRHLNNVQVRVSTMLVHRVGDDLVEDLEEGGVVRHRPRGEASRLVGQEDILGLGLDGAHVHPGPEKDVLDVAELPELLFDVTHRALLS